MALFNFKTSTLFAIVAFLFSIGFLVIMSFAYNKLEDLNVNPEDSDYCTKSCGISFQEVVTLKRTLIIGIILSLLLLIGISAMIYFERQLEQQHFRQLQEKLDSEGKMIVKEGGRVFVVDKDANVEKQIKALLESETKLAREKTIAGQTAAVKQQEESISTRRSEFEESQKVNLLKKQLDDLKAIPITGMTEAEKLQAQINQRKAEIAASVSERPVLPEVSELSTRTPAFPPSPPLPQMRPPSPFTSQPPSLNFPDSLGLKMRRHWRY